MTARNLLRLLPQIGGGILLPLLLLVSNPAAAEIRMLYPEPSSAVIQSRHLVLKLGSNDITAVVVTVNGVASDPLPIGTTEYKRAFRDFLILQPVWDKGKNQILVETFKDEKKQDSLKTEIFYAPKGETVEVPAEFPRARMHRPEAESLCVPCHNMRPTAKQFVDVADRDNPCFLCHKKMGSEKNVHTPVGMYSCVHCHPLQSSPKYEPVNRETKLCFSCHTDKQKEIKGYKLLHGPIAGGMCEICHDPHSSENPGQLRQSVNKLCLSCHESVGAGIHAIAIGDGTGHPIAGKTDISERGKGRELSCISCHNPHGSNARYYFVTGSDNKMELCQSCHSK